jgi:hypothetical protein
MFNQDFQDNKIPSNQKATVYYVGAGKGNHLPAIFKEYADYVEKWVLYDPVGFSFRCNCYQT